MNRYTLFAALLFTTFRSAAQDSILFSRLLITGGFRSPAIGYHNQLFVDGIAGPEVGIRYQPGKWWYDLQVFSGLKQFDYPRSSVLEDYGLKTPAHHRSSLTAGYTLIDNEILNPNGKRHKHLILGVRAGWFYYQETLYRSYGNTVNLTDTTSSRDRVFKSGIRRNNLMVGVELIHFSGKLRKSAKWHRTIHRLNIDGFCGLPATFTGFKIPLEPWPEPYYKWGEEATPISYSKSPEKQNALGTRASYSFIYGIGKHFGVTFNTSVYYLKMPEHNHINDRWGDIRGYTGPYPPFRIAVSFGLSWSSVAR